jgi:hypothetical protein
MRFGDRVNSGGRLPVAGSVVDGAGNPRRERHDGQLRPLPEHGDRAMPACGGERFDVDAARLPHPQAEQSEQARQGVVGWAGGGALGDERAELHPLKAQCGRLGVDLRPADALGRGVLPHSIDDREPVEPGDGRQASAHRGPGRPGVLHRSGPQLDVPALEREHIEVVAFAPGEEAPQVVRVAGPGSQ